MPSSNVGSYTTTETKEGYDFSDDERENIERCILISIVAIPCRIISLIASIMRCLKLGRFIRRCLFVIPQLPRFIMPI